MNSVIEQVAKPTITNYLCSKYGLTSEELLNYISNHFAKIRKSNSVALKYYYDNKDNPEYQGRLKHARRTYYQANKAKIKALTLAKYEHDSVFRENYKRYLALYSQRHRIRKHGETRGRPRKYVELETIKTSVFN